MRRPSSRDLVAERRERPVEVAATAEDVVDRLAALVADHLDRQDVDAAVRQAASHRGQPAGAVGQREADQRGLDHGSRDLTRRAVHWLGRDHRPPVRAPHPVGVRRSADEGRGVASVHDDDRRGRRHSSRRPDGGTRGVSGAGRPASGRRMLALHPPGETDVQGPPPLPLALAEAARPRLARELGRLDAICLLVTAIVAIDLIGAVANGGPQSLTWLAVVAALFFVPAGLAVSELGSAFPDEGGAYVWARLRLRPHRRRRHRVVLLVRHAGLARRLAGHPLRDGRRPLRVGPRAAPRAGPSCSAFVWARGRGGRGAAAPRPLADGERRAGPGRAAGAGHRERLRLYALDHGVQGLGARRARARTGPASWPSPRCSCTGWSASSCRAPRPARCAIRRATCRRPSAGRASSRWCSTPCPSWPILAVLPADRITSLSGFVDAMQSVFTVYGGHVEADGTPCSTARAAVLGALAAGAFAWVLLTNGLAWVMSAARIQAVACLDGAAPDGPGPVLAPHRHAGAASSWSAAWRPRPRQ